MCWTYWFHQVIQLLTLTYAKITLTFYNHCPIFVILPFIPQYSICKVDETILITSYMNSSLSHKILLMRTDNLLMRKWRNITPNLTNKTLNLTISQQWSKIWCIRIKIRMIRQKIYIHHRPMVLPLCSQIKRRIHHWDMDILQKMVICGLSNMKSAHQNSMNSSSI